MGLYYFITRGLIALLAAYLALYFLVASGPVKQTVQQLVADALPGSITAASIQWGPMPWHLRLADVRIHGARGEDVARVRAVEVNIDWPGTLAGLTGFIQDPEANPLALRFNRVELLDPWARVEVDQDYLVGIERAFVIDDGSPPDGTPAPYLDIRVALVRVINGGALVTAPGFHLDARGAHAVTDFALVGRDGDMFYDVPRTTVAEVEMRFDAFGHLPAPLAFTATDVVVDDFAWRQLGFTWRHATGTIPGGNFEGYGGLDAAAAVPTWHGGGRVELEPGSPILAELTREQVAGTVSAAIAGGGDVERVYATWQIESPHLEVAGHTLSDLVARGRFAPRPEALRLHAIHVDELQAGFAGGQVRVSDLAWEPHDHTRQLALLAELDHVDPRALWPAAPLAPRASGTVAITHRPALSGGFWDFELGRLHLHFEAPPAPGLPNDWYLEGAARITTDLPATSPALPRRTHPPADLEAEAPTRDLLTLTGLQLDGGDVRARLAGGIDLTAGLMELEPYLRLGSVTPLSRALAGRDVATADLPSGRLVLKAARLYGHLADPHLSATLNWTNARASSRDLGQISGGLSLAGGVLKTRELETRTAAVDAGPRENEPRRRIAGRFRLDGQVALFAPGAPGAMFPSPLSARPFSLSFKGVDGLVAAAFTDALGPDARLAIHDGSVSGTLEDPARSLTGRGRVRLTDATLFGERGVAIDGVVQLSPGLGLKLSGATLQLAEGARWRADLTIEPGAAPLEQRPWSAVVQVGATSLEHIGPLASLAPELKGVVRGHLSVGGSLSRPSVIGTVALERVQAGHLRLGSAELSLTTRTLPSGRRQLEASAFDNAFFPGFALQRAQLTLDGVTPRRFELAIDVADQDLALFVPALADLDGLTVRANLAAELDADLVADLTAFRVNAAPGDLIFSVGGRRPASTWHNVDPLLLTSDGRTVTLTPTRLGPVRRAEGRPAAADLGVDACGRIDLNTHALNLEVASNLDLALIPGLSGLLSVTRGRLISRPDDAAQASIGASTCLARPDVFHITGTAAAPQLIGRLETRGLAIVPRGSGRELRLRDGATVLVRSGPKGLTRLELGRDGTRFEGDLDDGSFGLTGEVELIDWIPRAMDLRVVGADLFLQSPGEFAITASPIGRVVATELHAEPKIAITGDLSIGEGRFSKSFDTFARALSGAIGVRGDAPSTSVLDDLPWLGAARLDVNVIANDFAIQTALPLAKTDLRARLDLTLRGTVGSPLLFRRVDLLPGGSLSYFVFERTFLVTQGSVDFDGEPDRPLVDVTAQTQITYLQRAQTALQEEDEKEVGVTLRMTGRVPDLKIELSSDDATLDQADIQSLLITGKPRGDLDRAQESQLVSADLATIINTVFSSPFVRRASVGVDQKGGLEYRLGTCFAPGLCFDTTTVSDDTETTLRAKFSLAIGDDVVCEGTLKRSDGASTSSQDTYQARCRYRIPLE